VLLSACGGSGGSNADGGDSGGVDGSPFVPNADITLLFMGNSHTSSNDVSGTVTAMVEATASGRTVFGIEAPGSMFLDERLAHAPSMNLLRDHNWSFVVLQAQKYSSSGQFNYSTAEAEELVRRSRVASAVPILFPEWPRKDVPETQRIYDLHVSIAQREPACVAPIGQAWDLSLARYPTLTLHADDGNHSAPAGAFLAALILYATITGLPPLELPFIEQMGVDAETQALLRGIADETVHMFSPRLWCPADA
jgi:hypothetical protein